MQQTNAGEGEHDLKLLEVNLLYSSIVRIDDDVSSRDRSQAKATLRDIIKTYADLTVLARLRGVPRASTGSDSKEALEMDLPIHVATALLCSQGLERSMIWP